MENIRNVLTKKYINENNAKDIHKLLNEHLLTENKITKKVAYAAADYVSGYSDLLEKEDVFKTAEIFKNKNFEKCVEKLKENIKICRQQKQFNQRAGDVCNRENEKHPNTSRYTKNNKKRC